MESQCDKLKNEMETGFIEGLYNIWKFPKMRGLQYRPQYVTNLTMGTLKMVSPIQEPPIYIFATKPRSAKIALNPTP